MKIGQWSVIAAGSLLLAASGVGLMLYAQNSAAPVPATSMPSKVPAASATVLIPALTAMPDATAIVPIPTPTTTPSANATSRPTATSTPGVLRYKFSDHTVSVSSDGSAWQERPQQFPEKIVSLISAASNSAVVYLLTTAPLSTSTNLRPVIRYTVQASRDGGLNWQPGASEQFGGCYTVNVGLRALISHATDADSLIVATQCVDNPSDARGFGMGARLSMDGGRSFVWSANGDGIQVGQTRDGILRFIPQRAEGERLALSTDRGATWQPLAPPALDIGYPSSSPLLEIDDGDANVVRLREQIGSKRVWESRDGGRTWRVLN